MLTISDKDKFVNKGPFWDKHPDIFPNVTRFEVTDTEGHIVESWERDKDGLMKETTERDKLREKIIAAQEELNRLESKANV